MSQASSIAIPATIERAPAVTPDEHKLLKKERIKFGFGTVLDQSEEAALGGLPTAIIRHLGGHHQHIGLFGACAGITSLFQFLGSFLLRHTGSNRKAMQAALVIGMVLSLFLALAIFSSRFTAFHGLSLYLYLGLAMLFAATAGMQVNVESNWIGDRVPKHCLGWFTSGKWFLAVVGIILFTFIIGKAGDLSPNAMGYGGVYLMFSASFAAAFFVYGSATDRPARTLNFLDKGASRSERLNYGSPALWCYIGFYVCWAGGRIILATFIPAFMMDVYGFSLTKLASLYILQYAVSLCLIFYMGKISDRSGPRKPLLLVSGAVALAMYLWVLSPWLGIAGLIVYQIIAGAAGYTHSMLAINFAIDLFPSKGRSAYLGFSRILIGLTVLATPILSGRLMHHLSGWKTIILGADFSAYHLIFLVSATMTLCSTVPLMLAGGRRVEGDSWR